MSEEEGNGAGGYQAERVRRERARKGEEGTTPRGWGGHEPARASEKKNARARKPNRAGEEDARAQAGGPVEEEGVLPTFAWFDPRFAPLPVGGHVYIYDI